MRSIGPCALPALSVIYLITHISLLLPFSTVNFPGYKMFECFFIKHTKILNALATSVNYFILNGTNWEVIYFFTQGYHLYHFPPSNVVLCWHVLVFPGMTGFHGETMLLCFVAMTIVPCDVSHAIYLLPLPPDTDHKCQ